MGRIDTGNVQYQTRLVVTYDRWQLPLQYAELLFIRDVTAQIDTTV